MTTTNDLLEHYVFDLMIGICSIKEDYLPTDIALEEEENVYVDGEEGFCNLTIAGTIVCKCLFNEGDIEGYEFTEFGKIIMNKVLKAYLENIAKTLN